MKWIRTIEKIASRVAPGRTPYFTEPHVIKALKMINSEGPIGRIKLSRSLGLSEGVIRTLIKHLQIEELIKTLKSGLILTNNGRRLLLDLKSKIKGEARLPESSLTIGPFNIAVLVKGVASNIKYGLEQRDAAIKVGALGATTLVFSHGKLGMPGVDEDIFKNTPLIREVILTKLKPEENDVVIIGSADNKLIAELGAVAAAIETLKRGKDSKAVSNMAHRVICSYGMA